MPSAVEFFVAPDDGVASEMGPQHRDHGFPAFMCAGLYPDDAMGDWEVLLGGGVATKPRVVVAMANDGFEAFAFPERLRLALARASAERLVEVARAWVGLATMKDEGISAEEAIEILTEVADLARTAEASRQPLYCWAI
ncbi:hypothetical protein OHA37_40590 (plasmid) [Streptomyces sp. NBC_00335]|uniref:hypothetical protein n=1 Tax=unclassified Streptomyces TaxID=2593676 RepID=UPI00225B08E2|nr:MULTISPECIES: hypothetical protein [unclassified Streptomyces]MCX5410128.1 hypothetical protein [Streptomyces sp. NBC_00086]